MGVLICGKNGGSCAPRPSGYSVAPCGASAEKFRKLARDEGKVAVATVRQSSREDSGFMPLTSRFRAHPAPFRFVFPVIRSTSRRVQPSKPLVRVLGFKNFQRRLVSFAKRFGRSPLECGASPRRFSAQSPSRGRGRPDPPSCLRIPAPHFRDQKGKPPISGMALIEGLCQSAWSPKSVVKNPELRAISPDSPRRLRIPAPRV